MATKKDKPGLSAKKLLRLTPRLFHNNSRDVIVKKFEDKVTKGGLRAIAALSFSPDSKTIKPHKQVVIGLDKSETTGRGLKISNCKRIKVQCSCQSYIYQGFEYANSLYGASEILYGNGDPPRTTNPQNSPGLCKHLVKIVSLILEKGK